MFSTTQLNSDGLYINVQVNPDGAHLYDNITPRLVIPIELKQAGNPQEGIVYELGTVFANLRCRYEPNRELTLDAQPYPIESSIEYGTGTIQLTFILGHEMLNRLELIRGGRTELAFSMYLKITARKLGLIPKQPNQEAPVTPIYVYLRGFSCQSSDIRLAINRDRWLTSLENVGFGKTLVFEFPTVPVENQESLSNAFAALHEAKRLHLLGFYDKAVGECRIAMDKFWDEKPKRLLDEWKTYMSEEEHKWLDLAFTAIRRGSNAPHHNARAGHDQFESLVFINLTASLVSYVARLGVAEKALDDES